MRERIRRPWTQEFYRFAQAALLLSIVLTGAGEAIGVPDRKPVHFLIAFAVLAAMSGMQRMTGRARMAAVLCPTVIVCMGFGIRNSFLFIRSYAGWLTGTDTWEPAWAAGYAVMQIIAVSVCCYLVQCVLEKYLLLKIIVLFGLVCTLVCCMMTGKPADHAAVVCSLSYIMVTGGEWIEWCWDKDQKKDRKAYMFWIMPFMAVYLFLMLWTPAPAKPFRWEFAREAFRQVKESVITMAQQIMRGGTENFDTALSGFSEDGRIRGDLEDGHHPAMIIQGEKDLAGNVYLSGKVFDVFDGRQWLRRDEGTAYEVFLDTIQTRYAAELFEGRYLHDCMALTTLHVRYEYFNSAYVFVPLKTQRIMEGNKDLSFIPAGGSLLFADTDHQNPVKSGYGTAYEAGFYQMNVGSEVFDDFLVSMQGRGVQSDTVMKTILQARTDRTGLPVTEEDLYTYIRQVHDIYTEDVVLSEAVRAYVDEITGSAQNEIEKLRMIEAELSAYTYTKSPGRLPGSVNDAGSFLDYFLLESREGYCTHFATAFALLARAEGLPSRYVQGFCVPAGQGEETVVYSDMAHSWPEVYIDGVGWIPFEPTPGYGSLRYTSWETGWKYEPSHAMGADPYAASGAAEDALSYSEMEETAAWEAAPGEQRAGYGLKIAVSTVLTLAAAGLLFAVLERAVRKKRYQKMNPAEKFSKAVRDNMRMLAWLGLRRGETETLQEFGRCAAETLGLAKDQPAFIETYEAFLYGDKSVDEEDVRKAADEGRQLLAVLREKKKRTFFYYRVRMFWD